MADGLAQLDRCKGHSADIAWVGMFRSVSELSGQIHHHDKLAASTHKRFRLLIALSIIMLS
jgi:hypothetical protein